MLEVRGLSKSYHGRKVLSDVSFFLPAGACIGIAGDNGSGKSTLLRLLAQIHKPDSGDLLYQGRSVMGDKEFFRKNVGYVPQHSDLLPGLTVKQQLKLWQSACGVKGAADEGIMQMLGIEELLPIRTDELSGGQQRRVSIAMALLSKPKILIMDEVTAGLDRGYCEQLLTWLEAYLEMGGRIIWCSHHPAEIERLCGDCIRLCGGVRQDL